MTHVPEATLASEMSRIRLACRDCGDHRSAGDLRGGLCCGLRSGLSRARRGKPGGPSPPAGTRRPAHAISNWLTARPDSSEAHLLKGRVALANGNLNEVADELKRVQVLGHPRDELALLQALIASKLGRHAEAEPVLKRGIRGAARSRTGRSTRRWQRCISKLTI